MSDIQENQQQDQNSGDKISKRYDEIVLKVVSVLNGNKDVLFKPLKIANTEVSDIVQELFKEETEEKKVNFKKKMKEGITLHVNFVREEKKLRKEVEEAVSKKKQEIIKYFEDVLKEVEDINSLHRDFLQSLETE